MRGWSWQEAVPTAHARTAASCPVPGDCRARVEVMGLGAEHAFAVGSAAVAVTVRTDKATQVRCSVVWRARAADSCWRRCPVLCARSSDFACTITKLRLGQSGTVAPPSKSETLGWALLALMDNQYFGYILSGLGSLRGFCFFCSCHRQHGSLFFFMTRE